MVPVVFNAADSVSEVEVEIVKVFPDPIVNGPENVTDPPVAKLVVPAELDKINSLSDPKLLGEPPVPSGVPLQLLVKYKLEAFADLG